MVMILWIYVNINTPSAVDLRHQSEGAVTTDASIPDHSYKPGYYFELYASWGRSWVDFVFCLSVTQPPPPRSPPALIAALATTKHRTRSSGANDASPQCANEHTDAGATRPTSSSTATVPFFIAAEDFAS